MKMSIPFHELDFSFARSSGPGGQNVNKVNSKAVLRWSLATTCALRDEDKAYLLGRLANRLTVDGDLIVTCDEFRDQPRNKESCIRKLHAILDAALIRPKPRKKTKPTKSKLAKRKESKQLHSKKKKMRSGKYEF